MVYVILGDREQLLREKKRQVLRYNNACKEKYDEEHGQIKESVQAKNIPVVFDEAQHHLSSETNLWKSSDGKNKRTLITFMLRRLKQYDISAFVCGTNLSLANCADMASSVGTISGDNEAYRPMFNFL